MTDFQTSIIQAMADYEPDDKIDTELGWAERFNWGEVVIFDIMPYMGSREIKVVTDLVLAETFWLDLTMKFSQGEEPQEGDYVIETTGLYKVSPLRLSFHRWEDVILAIATHCQEDSVWPDIWLVSDHGNFTKINLDEELKNINPEEEQA